MQIVGLIPHLCSLADLASLRSKECKVGRSPFSIQSYHDTYEQWRRHFLKTQSLPRQGEWPSLSGSHFPEAGPGPMPCGTGFNFGAITGGEDPGFNLAAIIGGEGAPEHAWPWHALVHGKKRLNNGTTISQICGGALIADQWVLTAAHCLDSAWSYKVIMGRLRVSGFNFKSKDVFYEDAQVEKYFQHELFNREGKMSNDIALLKLLSPVRFSAYLQPECLPRRNVDLTSPYIDCYISGYGRMQYDDQMRAETLQQLKVGVMDFWQCKNLWPDFIGQGHLCLRFPETPGAGACLGDSGGPLSCIEPGGAFFVAGLSSFVHHRCTKEKKPDVYTKVSAYKPWILDTIEKEVGQLPPPLNQSLP